MATVGRGAEQYTVRFPSGLRDQIKDAAEANNRSMNSEIIARLQASFSTKMASSDVPNEAAKRIAEDIFKYLSEEGWTPPKHVTPKENPVPTGKRAVDLGDD